MSPLFATKMVCEETNFWSFAKPNVLGFLSSRGVKSRVLRDSWRKTEKPIVLQWSEEKALMFSGKLVLQTTSICNFPLKLYLFSKSDSVFARFLSARVALLDSSKHNKTDPDWKQIRFPKHAGALVSTKSTVEPRSAPWLPCRFQKRNESKL